MIPSQAFSQKTLLSYVNETVKDIKSGFSSRVKEQRESLLAMRRSPLRPIDDGLIRVSKGKYLNALPVNKSKTLWNIVAISDRVVTPSAALLEMIVSRDLSKEFGHIALPSERECAAMLFASLDETTKESLKKKPTAKTIFEVASQESELSKYFSLHQSSAVKKPLTQSPFTDFYEAVDSGRGMNDALDIVEKIKVRFEQDDIKAPQAIFLLNDIAHSIEVSEREMEKATAHKDFDKFFRDGNFSITPEHDAPLDVIGVLKSDTAKMRKSGKFDIQTSQSIKLFEPTDNFADIVSAIQTARFINSLPSIDEVVSHHIPINLGVQR